MKNVIIPNKKELEKAKKSILKAGAEKLHVLADFDRTLTTAGVPSIMSILRDGTYLTSDYAPRARELYEKYHPIEIDPDIPLEEKKKAMQEWWTIHFDLLIKSGLEKTDLIRVVESDKIKFREGFGDFIDFLKAKDIPLIIMSSSGLGREVISMCLEKNKKLYNNIYIISNSFQWDENGKIIKIQEPIIHVMNKDETSVKNFPVFEKIKDRKNVLLLGDSIGDIGMIKGFEYENLIKVGFLNENMEKNLEEYKKNYDVIVPGDYSMDFINKLLKETIK